MIRFFWKAPTITAFFHNFERIRDHGRGTPLFNCSQTYSIVLIFFWETKAQTTNHGCQLVLCVLFYVIHLWNSCRYDWGVSGACSIKKLIKPPNLQLPLLSFFPNFFLRRFGFFNIVSVGFVLWWCKKRSICVQQNKTNYTFVRICIIYNSIFN